MAFSAVIVTDTDGTQLGEIPNLKDRKISIRLRRPTTVSFTVPLRAKMAAPLIGGDVLVKLYEIDPELQALVGNDTFIRFSGPVQSAEPVVQERQATVAVVAVSPSGELDDRLCGKSTVGVSFPEGTQRGGAIVSLLNTTNAESPTLLRPGTVQATPALGTGGVGPWRFKQVSEAVADLASPLDGCDWLDRPVEPGRDALGAYCGLLDIWPAKGSRRPAAIFELGTGRSNVRGYRHPVTRIGMLNQAYSLPPGFPDNVAAGDTVLTKADAGSIASRRLREAVIQSDLTVPALRQKLLDEHVALRARPIERIQFDPMPHGRVRAGRRLPVPRMWVDYDIGDVVEFRAVKHGVVLFDGLCRVYGADISLSDTGVVTVSPILVPEGS